MASERTTSNRRRVPAWKHRWLLFERLMLNDTFPDANGYAGSLWADWESRIKTGHKWEDDRLTRLAESWQDVGDWLVDDVYQMNRLTNSMYAALVVSLWADVEAFLKGLIRVCSQAMSLPQSNVGNKIPEIANFYEKRIGLNLWTIRDASTVNALRLLNNSFKHDGGRYEPTKGKIEQTLLDTWHILNERGEIQYHELPIKELVVACNTFCVDLLAKLEPKLETLAVGSENDA